MQPSESVQLVPGQKVNGREGSARLVNIVQSTTVVSGPVEWLIRITVHESRFTVQCDSCPVRTTTVVRDLVERLIRCHTLTVREM